MTPLRVAVFAAWVTVVALIGWSATGRIPLLDIVVIVAVLCAAPIVVAVLAERDYQDRYR